MTEKIPREDYWKYDGLKLLEIFQDNAFDTHMQDIKDCDGTDLLEFGTYSGYTFCYMIQQSLSVTRHKFRKYFTIDCFRGLPEEGEGIDYKHPEWEVGNFDSRRLVGVGSSHEAYREISERIWQTAEKMKPGISRDVNIIKAYYEYLEFDPLYEIKKFNIGKLCYVNVDCDLYKSAKEALNFVFRNDLLAVNGLIRYDDWHVDNSMYGEATKKINGGEALAHREIEREYNLRFEYLGQNTFKYLGKKENKI